jgi:hypothetical protein
MHQTGRRTGVEVVLVATVQVEREAFVATGDHEFVEIGW